MDPRASLSMKLLKSDSGTMSSPLGSSAFIHIFSNSSVESVKSSRKHFRLRNWSHSMFTLSLVVSMLNAWISLLLTSTNLSANDVVFSINTLSVMDGPSTCTAALCLSSAPSACPAASVPSSAGAPSIVSFFLSSSWMVMRDQNSASS